MQAPPEQFLEKACQDFPDLQELETVAKIALAEELALRNLFGNFGPDEWRRI
jgi:hypothetical protein